MRTNLRTKSFLLAAAVLSLGLLLLLARPANAQGESDSEQQDEKAPHSWSKRLATEEGIRQQFQDNPVLFFALIYALGVAVSLTPCVLPMIPITVSIISGSKQQTQSRSRIRTALMGLLTSAVYVLGVSITYAILGLVVASAGGKFRSYLQDRPVQVAMGTLFVILGLSMTGLIYLPLPGWGRGTMDNITHRQQAKRSLLTVFVLGLVSGIIASPCVVPVVGALLLWISSAGPWLGFWALFTFGEGMGLLLIVVGLTGWVLSSGKWMLAVKTILGVLLMLMGLLVAVQSILGEPVIPSGWLEG